MKRNLIHPLVIVLVLTNGIAIALSSTSYNVYLLYLGICIGIYVYLIGETFIEWVRQNA